MADLSKREQPRNARRRLSDNQTYLMPASRDTRAPGLEVNAPIVGKNNSKATALLDILNVGAKAANQGVDYLDQKAAEQRQIDRSSGATADIANKPDAERLAKSRAYAQGYYVSGAQRTLIETQDRVKQAVDARLNDTTQDPATPEDIHQLINDEFAKVALNEDGTTRNFGDPLAAETMVNGLSKIRAAIVPDALDKIKEQTDDHLIGNLMFNLAHGVGLKELGHEEPPAKLALSNDGVPKPGAIKTIDPNTALGDAPAAVKAVAKPVTGRLPIQGTITSTYAAHLGRGSHGLDIDGQKGDPVEAPAGGKVIRAGYDAKSGNFVMIDHGNGIVSSYAHLDKRYYKAGQIIQAGDTLGTVGNTGHVDAGGGGDGSHLHYRVRVDGKDVDPAKFAFDGVKAPDGTTTADLSGIKAAPTPVTPVAYDFEAVMAQKPPSMDPKTFKTKAIAALTDYADEAKRPDILEGLAMSVRKDGTPSFSPEEILKLRDTADTLRNKHYREAQFAERQLHEANEEKMLDMFTMGSDPSVSQIQDWRRKNLIGDKFANAMVSHIEVEQHRDEVESRVEARQAKAEAEQNIDDYVTAETINRQYGRFYSPTDPKKGVEDPLDLYQQGKLGSGTKALRRLAQLRAADKTGADYLEKTPAGATGLTMLDTQFPAKKAGSGNDFASLTGTGTTNAALRAAAYAAYDEELKKGTSPIVAAQKVIKDFAPFKQSKDPESYFKARQAALKAKAAQP